MWARSMKFGPRRFPFGITGDTHRIGPPVGPDHVPVVAPGKEVGIKATFAHGIIADTVPVAVDRSGQPPHAVSFLDPGRRHSIIPVAAGWRVARCGSDLRQMFKGGVEVVSLAVHHQVDAPPRAGSAEMVEELAAVDAEDGPRAFLAVESDRPGQGLEPKVHTGCGGTRGCWPVLVAKGYQRRGHIGIKIGKQALDDC